MIGINSLYAVAGALSSVFVAVYLFTQGDFATICRFQLTCFAVTPFFFIVGGWYAQARDRLHAYRLGLILNASFYALLLILRESAPHYDIGLGVLAGATGGIYWVAANTLSYDMTAAGAREYYIGLMATITGAVGLVAPFIGGLIIHYSPEPHLGYEILFGGVVILYTICIILSFRLPKDNVRRPFRIKRAMFPKKEQRDWRLALWVSLSLSGSYIIFPLVLNLLMYMHTKSEVKVGGFSSYQALIALVTTFLIGRTARSGNRLRFLFAGVATLLVAGSLMLFPLNFYVLVAFGFLRSLSQALFVIPHGGLNYEIINNDAEDPSQRIEYLCVWEFPLAAGRIIMMGTMLFLYQWLSGNELAIRITLFLLCAIRIVSYILIRKTSPIQAEIRERKGLEPAGEPVTEAEH